MKYNKLFESLDKKVGDQLVVRRYSLSDMISESYKALYSCESGTNLYSLLEAHLEDVRENPTEIDRLSRQLSIMKEVIRLKESKKLHDEDLDLSPIKLKRKKLKESIQVPEEKDIDEANDELDSELTDEEVEELAKHLTELRKNKKTVNTDESCKKTVEESKSHKLRKKESVKVDEVKDFEDDQSLWAVVKSDGSYAGGPCTSEDEARELSIQHEDSLIYKLTLDSSSSTAVGDLSETLQNGKTDSRESEVLDLVFSYLRDQYDDAEFADICREKFGMTDEELSSFCSIDESVEDTVKNTGDLVDKKAHDTLEPKKVTESNSWDKINLSDFTKKSASKAFVKTFKKLNKKLHEGVALTRQESISLYKASNSAMTHLSVELEHNPDFLPTFNEATTLLTSDVNKILESMKNGKAPSKKTMKSLAKFSEALLCESKISKEAKDYLDQLDIAKEKKEKILLDIESKGSYWVGDLGNFKNAEEFAKLVNEDICEAEDDEELKESSSKNSSLNKWKDPWDKFEKYGVSEEEVDKLAHELKYDSGLTSEEANEVWKLYAKKHNIKESKRYNIKNASLVGLRDSSDWDYEGEYKGEKIQITPEGDAGRGVYVQGKLYYMDGGSVEEVLNRLKSDLGNSKNLKESDEEDEIPAIEDDEEDFVGDDEGDIASEESEEFDQEYADARVELHKELVDKHGDTEDPDVQDKIAQDAGEVEALPGITDEQVDELEDLHEPTEEETPEEEPEEESEESDPEGDNSDEITPDELAELKKHLKEMRAIKK